MHSQPIRIGVIALSRFLEDPRVRRQCDALQGNGFQVFAIGEDDEGDERVDWVVVKRSSVRSSEGMVRRTIRQKLFLLTKNEGRRLLLSKVEGATRVAVVGILGEARSKFIQRAIFFCQGSALPGRTAVRSKDLLVMERQDQRSLRKGNASALRHLAR